MGFDVNKEVAFTVASEVHGSISHELFSFKSQPPMAELKRVPAAHVCLTSTSPLHNIHLSHPAGSWTFEIPTPRHGRQLVAVLAVHDGALVASSITNTKGLLQVALKATPATHEKYFSQADGSTTNPVFTSPTMVLQGFTGAISAMAQLTKQATTNDFSNTRNKGILC